jgi:hypothetical protein
VIHYHGVPFGGRREKFLEMAGRNFCVSYANPGDVEVCHRIGQSVMLDNGAYSIWRRAQSGGPIPARVADAARGDWTDFYRWVEPWLAYQTTWAVIPDVIDGNAAANDALLIDWPHGEKGAPVWHLHEPIERLLDLAANWPRVCLGSSGEYATVGDARWHRRMASAMNALCGNGPPPCWIHMLRGLSLAGSHYPFASADSVNVGRNHLGNNDGRRIRDPRRMADEIDGRQCPARWQPTERGQEAFF